MTRCAVCGEPLQKVVLVCYYCGEELPVRIVVMSEGSRGGWFAVLEGDPEQRGQSEERRGGRANGDA
ncbi:MAG TPA: hypothetical protein EYH27_03195 [Anaerolineales bacterium]|nr:hypothetical protein [Anaerolineales bacterium]